MALDRLSDRFETAEAGLSRLSHLVGPEMQGASGLAGCAGGFYLLYVDPGVDIVYTEVLWVAVLLVVGGLLLGHAAGSA